MEEKTENHNKDLSGREGLEETIKAVKKKKAQAIKSQIESEETIISDQSDLMSRESAESITNLTVGCIVKPILQTTASVYDPLAQEVGMKDFTFALIEPEERQLKQCLVECYKTIPYSVLVKLMPWIALGVTTLSIANTRIQAARTIKKLYNQGVRKDAEPKENKSGDGDGKQGLRKNNAHSEFAENMARFGIS